MPTALVPVADGVEEIEAVAVVDTLRRGGVEVTMAAVGERLEVKASRGVRLLADALLDGVEGGTFDAIVVPGGLEGARALAASKSLARMMKAQIEAGRLLAAICASPALVLQPQGLLIDRLACCYPSFMEKLDRPVPDARVVVEGNIVTSVGPGSAIEFALRILGILTSVEASEAVGRAMLHPA